MDVTIRSFTKDDYGTIDDWWMDHNSYSPRPEHLPRTGLVVEVDDKPVSAGFLYQTDSKICVFEFVVSDPMAHKEHRDVAIDRLIQAAIEWARVYEYTLIYTSISIPRYIERLKDKGFVTTNTNQTHLFKEVRDV